MKKVIVLLVISISLSSCCWLFNDCDCEVENKPDLISNLTVPTLDIILGETVDWEYVIESIEDNVKQCETVQAGASIARILIDYFSDQSDNDGEIVLNEESPVSPLNEGQSKSINTSISVFEQEGIYMIGTKADITDVVEERNEQNNEDIGSVEAKVLTNPNLDPFIAASNEFKERLSSSAAIVIVGSSNYLNPKISEYKGKRIYYVK